MNRNNYTEGPLPIRHLLDLYNEINKKHLDDYKDTATAATIDEPRPTRSERYKALFEKTPDQ